MAAPRPTAPVTRHVSPVMLALAAVIMLGICQADCAPQQDTAGRIGRALSQTVSPSIEDGWYDGFHNYAEIVTRMNQLASANDPLVTVHAMDVQTVEGRDIRYMKIAARQGIAQRVVLVGLQHAREWIAASATMMAAERLIAGIGSDSAIDSVLAQLEVIVVPVLNPDGLEFTFSPEGHACLNYMTSQSLCDRMWRKNRQELEGTTCLGIDLNRAWPLDWGARGGEGLTPNNACAEDYPGKHPLQPPEAMALCRLMAQLHGADPAVLCNTSGGGQAAANWGQQGKLPSEGVVGFLDIHSYGQMILGCWAHVNSPSYNRVVLDGIGVMMEEAVNAECSSDSCRWTYGIGDLGGEIYLTSGVLPDWTYWALGAASYTLELPPKTWFDGGFTPGTNQVKEYAGATFPAVLALMNGVLTEWQIAEPADGTLGPAQCLDEEDGHTLEIRNRLDYYPREMSWTLQTTSGQALAGWDQASGGRRLEDSATGGIVKLCGGTYVVMYRDSAGDGICCNEGHGDVSIMADGIELYHGDGAFGREQAVAVLLGSELDARQLQLSSDDGSQAVEEAFVFSELVTDGQVPPGGTVSEAVDRGGLVRPELVAIAAAAACVLLVAVASALGFIAWRRYRGQRHRLISIPSEEGSQQTSGRRLLVVRGGGANGSYDPSDSLVQRDGSIQLQPLA